MNSGLIGAYTWIECAPSRETAFHETLRSLQRHLIGLRAVNVSWDSGLFVPSDAERARGWQTDEGRAITPVLDAALIEAWPWGNCGFEEWYFFARLPRSLNLSAYCNWLGVSISGWAALVEVPNAFDLSKQLETARPELVLGEGYQLFAISSTPEIIDDLPRALANA